MEGTYFVNETMNDVNTNLKANLYMSRLSRLIFGIVLPIAFLALGVVLLVLDTPLFFPIFLFVAAVVLVVFFAFFAKFMRKMIEKVMTEQPLVKYTFTENEFIADSETENGVLKGGYGAFSKCEEYEDMWLLYSKSTVFPLRKGCMMEGTADDLSVFLAVRLNDRYKIKYRKK